MSDLPETFGIAAGDTADGNQTWIDRGSWHRGDDLPAYIGRDGTQAWYWNGKAHREGDRPAYINKEGDKVWYQHDRKHRLLGPAVVYGDKRKPDEYWIHGTQRTAENHAEYLAAHRPQLEQEGQAVKEHLQNGSTAKITPLKKISFKQ